MNYCGTCGEEIAEDSHFCPHCGSEIKNIDITDPGSLFWKGQIPIVTSSVVVQQLAMAFGVGTLFLFFCS